MESRLHDNIADRLASSSLSDLKQYDGENYPNGDDNLDDLDLADTWGGQGLDVDSLTGSLLSTTLTI